MLKKMAVVLLLSGCSFFPAGRKPASLNDFATYSLLDKSQFIIDAIATREVNPYSCAKMFESMALDYENNLELLDIQDIKKNGQAILAKSFQARLTLNSMLDVYPHACKKQLQQLVYNIRMVEDLVGVYFYGNKQISADSIDYQKGPIPLYDVKQFNPYQTSLKKKDKNAKFEFKSGDIIISKGISFISSAISEIPTPKSLYSHLGLVYVDPKTKEIKTIESFIGKGVGIYSIEEALKNESVRYVVLRSKDEELAGQAAKYMFERVSEAQKAGRIIEYDYLLDFKDNTKLSCEEVVYDAYKTASKGKVVIPEIISEIHFYNKKLMALVGMNKIPMMIPSDVELDSRFDLVLDWTDHRVLRDSWRKDAVIGEMGRWLEVYDYKLSDISSHAGKNPNQIFAEVSGKVKKVGDLLLRHLVQIDEAHFKNTGRWLNSRELRDTLDEYRRANPQSLKKLLR